MTTEIQQAIAAILEGLRSAEPDHAFLIVRIAPDNVGSVTVAAPDGIDPLGILAAAVGIIDDHLTDHIEKATR